METYDEEATDELSGCRGGCGRSAQSVLDSGVVWFVICGMGLGLALWGGIRFYSL